MSKFLYQWLDEWYTHFHRDKVELSTSKSNTYVMKRIKKYQPDIPLSDLTVIDAQKIFNDMYNGGYAKSSIHKARCLLNQAYRLAVDSRYISHNPIPLTYKPNASTESVIAFTKDEQKNIESIASDILYGDVFIFLLYTGLRLGEFFNLKWFDFSQETNTISIIKSKTKAGVREIYLPLKARAVIDKQLHINEYIFNSNNKNPFTYSVMNKLCKRVIRSAKVTKATSHMCRHTFATRLIENGVNPKSVSTLLGHSSVKFTYEVYVSIEKKQLIKDLAILDNMTFD